MWFPVDTETGQINANGDWEIDFPTYNTNRQLQWIALSGPPGSSVSVFLNTIFIDTTPRGDLNRADYYSGIPIAHGQQLRLVWNVGTGSAPTASIGMTDGNMSSAGGAANSGLFTMAS